MTDLTPRAPRRRLTLLLASSLLVSLMALGAGSSSAREVGEPTASQSPESLLFVQTASKGRLHRNGAGKLTLSLRTSRWTQSFTDRPQRRAGKEKTRAFVGSWAERGFRADPPNAALSIDRRNGHAMSFELERPRFARGWLRYSVKALKGSAKVKLGRFGRASLFIDNAFEGGCQGQFGMPIPCSAITPRMILVFETPAVQTVTFNVTLNGGSASFSPNQFAGGYTGVGYNSPNSVTISRNSPDSWPDYVPVVVQGSGAFEVTTSLPVQVAPDNYSYTPVGPNTPVTYSLPD